MRSDHALALVLAAALAAPAAAGDTYTVTLEESARSEPATGRIILFFITETSGRWARVPPAAGPFFERPQPIASVAVEELRPGASVTIDGEAVSWPQPLDALDGPVRVQAVLDASRTERGWSAERGNVMSEVVETTLAADRADRIELRLSRPVEEDAPPDAPNVEWVTLRSALLSAHYGRDVFHRAGVALPRAYQDEPAPRRPWPAVYVVPAFGGRHLDAAEYGVMFEAPGVEEVAPMAVHVVLDPESPLGHHGFVDSPANGPRGTALVTELIPYLDQRYQLAAQPEARIVTGHSSGAWTTMWLLVSHPETFGAGWATAPDPVDFHAFQTIDLYEDASLFTDPAGRDRPSMRRIVDREGTAEVRMTVRQECGMEHAIDPHGRSGQQWDAYAAMFSPLDETTGAPRPMFDPVTGVIDHEVVAYWARYDLARLVTSDWTRHGPVVMRRLRLLCGAEDSFYLERAVRRFKERVEAAAEAAGGWAGDGYVKLVPFATHGNLRNYVFMDLNAEMRAHLARHGFALNGPETAP